MEYIDWDLAAERSIVGVETLDKDSSWNINFLSSTARAYEPGMDVSHCVNEMLSPYRTFESVSGCVPITSSASTPDMTSPLSIASSLDSIWSTAEQLPGWPPTDAMSMVVTNTTGIEAPLASRILHNASAPSVSLKNATSSMASERRDESLASPGPSTPSFSECSTEYLDEISDDGLVVACRKLRRHLRAHYPNTKPPGDLFEPFIQRLRRQNHCRLCSKVLDNREQMNQHIMKNHCGHLPFACPVQGCNHRDARQADLRKHLEKHSNVRLPCPACQKPFANKRNLVRHLQQIHPKFEHGLVTRRAPRKRARRH